MKWLRRLLGRYTDDERWQAFKDGTNFGRFAANKERWDAHRARVNELLDANNRYQQEAQDARARAVKAEAALAVLDVAFCVRHGSFPVDRSTPDQRFLNDSMKIARKVTGDNYGERVALAEATLAVYRGATQIVIDPLMEHVT